MSMLASFLEQSVVSGHGTQSSAGSWLKLVLNLTRWKTNSMSFGHIPPMCQDAAMAGIMFAFNPLRAKFFRVNIDIYLHP